MSLSFTYNPYFLQIDCNCCFRDKSFALLKDIFPQPKDLFPSFDLSRLFACLFIYLLIYVYPVF